eukprot:CAMPEP_0119489862 /NCGR_PEP_ID=MMETSP1344-20130328/15196_1 /TAXON_ID=236787 /ORGANISM="Florenciella parvula, Strain CCMP2471" /LENGTH=136 /DNA_ID=CAMNT_0007524953 /DNA_START=121 /DNA_END=532 /DNA_ORIENTATION=+
MSDAATPNTEEPAATPGESSDAGEVPAVAASTDSGVVAVQKRRGSLLRQTSNFTDEAMARKVRQGRLLTFADEATTEKPAGDRAERSIQKIYTTRISMAAKRASSRSSPRVAAVQSHSRRHNGDYETVRPEICPSI